MRGLALVVAGAFALGVAGCAPPTEVDDARLSLDGTRVAVTFASCNEAEPVEVDETASEVTVTPSGSGGLIELAGDDCQDVVVVEFVEPLGDRELINGATGDVVDVAPAPPENTIDWPYDRDQFTAEEFEAALDAMVACLEAEDPLMDAWVVQELDWAWWDFAKESDESGTMEAPAIEVCRERVLAPLRG